ncbi:MAG: hypothetical protein ACYTBX_19945 [Planctomycetota bacterium]|jgi:hypothetical protein
MNKAEYKNLKRQVEEKYQKSLKLAEKQRNEGLEAIELVWSLLHNIEETLAPFTFTEKTEKLSPKTKEKYGSLTAAIKEALEHVKVKFNKNDIMLVLKQTKPELAKSINQGSLAGCLMRYVKHDIIKIHKRGKGSTPTVYKKVDTQLFDKG